MKTKLLKYALLFLLPVGMLFASCSKDDDDDSIDPAASGKMTIKCGTVEYNNDLTFAFKDYGKVFAYLTSEGRVIVDGNAKKAYSLDNSDKTYVEYSGDLYALWSFNPYASDESTWQFLPGINKSTTTIAGKSCTLWSWKAESVDIKYAVYEGIIFKCSDGEDNFEATSFDSAEPNASVFSLVGFTKLADI